MRGPWWWFWDKVYERRETERWFLGLIVVIAVLQLFSYLRYYSSHTFREGLVEDPLTFELTGRYILNGGRLYVDVWEPKPPLSFETAAFLALLSFGDTTVLHLLGLAASLVAIIGIALVIALLTYDLTDDLLAAVIAGLVPFVLPAFHYTANRGFHDKYFVVFAGMLAIYFAVKDRPTASGGAAAVAVGYVQLGAIYPVLALSIAWTRGGRRQVGRAIAGFVLVAAVILAPIVFWGVENQMVAQAVLIPFIVEGGVKSTFHIASLSYRVLLHFSYGVIVALVGAYGLRYVPYRYRGGWWIPVGGVWTLATVLLFEFDGANDLFMGLGFLAVSVGLFAATARPTGRRILSGVIVAVVTTSVVFQGGFGVLFGGDDPVVKQIGKEIQEDMAGSGGEGSVQIDSGKSTGSDSKRVTRLIERYPTPSTLYWNQKQPRNCWYLLPDSGDLQSWVRYIDESPEFAFSERRPSRASPESSQYICHDYDLTKLLRLALL